MKYDSVNSASKYLANPAQGEQVCITGAAGCFPDADDIDQFKQKLYDKVDMVTNDQRRWKLTHPEIPQRSGKINHITKFDAAFFGIHFRQVHTVDPMTRIMLEKTFEAIVDAGCHPQELRGTRTGVFISTSFVESEKTWLCDKLVSKYCAVTGCLKTMIANRISYWLGVEGPSFAADTSCSSSLYTLQEAYRAIREGKCDQAIVGGCHLCLFPSVTLKFNRMGVLSTDGVCKAFDDEANGYVRSEAVVVYFLQKAKNSRRIYAEILHMQTNCDGFKEQSITYLSGSMHKVLYNQFYQECPINPSTLTFIEGHVTGTKVGDPEEVNSLHEVFCKHRSTPLYIGSVKSNIGHTEPVSGLCSIAKIIIAMENGYIPPNIHYIKPRETINALKSGEITVATEKVLLPDNNGLFAVNNFGFGGANGHLLLRWNLKEKNNKGLPEDDLPRLVCVSGRTTNSVARILDDLKSKAIDVEYVRLLHQVFRQRIDGHIFRGFAILTNHQEVHRSINYLNAKRPPLICIFTSFEVDWLSVSNELLGIPLFIDIITKLQNILTTRNINITKVLMGKISEENVSVQKLLYVILQIAIVEFLQIMDIRPDYVVGCGFGQLASAYVNETLSLEDTLFLALSISRNDVANQLNKLHFKTKFMPIILNLLMEESKATIYKKNFCIESINKFEKISERSLILEVGTGKLLLSTYYNQEIFNLTSQKKNSFIKNLLTELGRLYASGIDFKTENLYPEVEWPVSRTTPMLSHLITWDHQDDWFVSFHDNEEQINNGQCTISVNINDKDWAFIAGHIIDGRNIFPGTGYLFMVWKTLSKMLNMMMEDMQIVFENIRFIRATTIISDENINFIVIVRKGGGNFEVRKNDVVIVTGQVFISEKFAQEITNFLVSNKNDDQLTMSKIDIYKELRMRSYNYRNEFCGIEKCNNTATAGLIQWTGNWVTFLDNMMQLSILQTNSRKLQLAVNIQRLAIDAPAHLKYINESRDNFNVPIRNYPECGIIKSVAVEIKGLCMSPIRIREFCKKPVLETYCFIPNETTLMIEQAIRVNMQIVIENIRTLKVKVVEKIDVNMASGLELLTPLIAEVLDSQPLIQSELVILSEKPMKVLNATVEIKELLTESDCTVVIITKIFNNITSMQKIFNILKPDGFLITRENIDFDHKLLDAYSEIELVTVYTNMQEKLIMARKRKKCNNAKIVKISDNTKDWLPKLQEVINSDWNVIIYSENDPFSGILGLNNCLQKEQTDCNLQCLYIANTAPTFDPNSLFYKTQLQKSLSINVYKNSQWGTYRHLLLETTTRSRDNEHFYINTTIPGDISSLSWIEGPIRSDTVLEGGKTLVLVYYAALNFEDNQMMLGRSTKECLTPKRIAETECVLGLEFVGRDTKGNRLMGMVTSGALSTVVAGDSNLLWPVPEKWSMEDAATIPVIYSILLYVFHSLIDKKTMGKTVLIQTGSSSFGQATIRLALHNGMVVFTTVEDQKQTNFIKENFRHINERNIFNSSSTIFEQQILHETKGQGVDYICNFSEKNLDSSLRCLATGGKFINVGDTDTLSRASMNLNFFENGRSFHAISLERFFKEAPINNQLLRNLLSNGIENGSVKPLARTVFQTDMIEQAFRYMMGEKHTKKVLIKIRDEVKVTDNTGCKLIKSVPRYRCNPDGVYIITEGLDEFGLELANWLVLHGARKLLITSRHSFTTGYQKFRMRSWKLYGVHAQIFTINIITKEACIKLIKRANILGTVDAIFHNFNSLTVTANIPFEDQTVTNFEENFTSQVLIIQHLDNISRSLCSQLRHFVTFSSMACGRGNEGQTSFGMASSVIERICEQRKKDGFPGLAIQWGSTSDIDIVNNTKENYGMKNNGIAQQRITDCLEVFESFLLQEATIVASMIVAEKYDHNNDKMSNVIGVVTRTLGFKNLKSISPYATFSELGMDSLSVIEIKTILEKELDIFLTSQDVRNLTFSQLQQIADEAENENKIRRSYTGTTERRYSFEQITRYFGSDKASNLPMICISNIGQVKMTEVKLFLIPGLEGMAPVMETLALNLTAQTFCLQFGCTKTHDSIYEIAKSLLPIVQQNLTPCTPFMLIGYSFGCLVTIELSILLEKEGLKGNVILIDGSPKMAIRYAKQQFETTTDEKIQTSVLCTFMSYFLPVTLIAKYSTNLLQCNSFEERVQTILDSVPKDGPYSPDYFRELVTGMYNRLKAIINYNIPSKKIKAIVKLYRPSTPSIIDIADDYELSEICEESVEVSFFKGTHATILQNSQLSSAINDLVKTLH